MTISVTPYPARPNTPWKVDVPAKIAGRRKRRFFASREAAELWASQKNEEFLDVGRKAFTDGLSFSDAVTRFVARVEGSEVHKTRTKGILGKFGVEHGNRALGNIGPAMIETYLMRFENKNTRASHYRYLRMLFRWAWRMELIPRNPMMSLDSPKTSPKRNILTPVQMKAILELDMPDWLWNFHIVGAFAGLRSSEIVELRHTDINHTRKIIHVRPGTQKGTDWGERYVDITAPFKRHFRKAKGLVGTKDQKELSEARYQYIVNPLGWTKWPEGCLRHSFATYHLAKHQDAAKTAHQMGHTSIQMVTRVYAQPARGVTANAWWRL